MTAVDEHWLSHLDALLLESVPQAVYVAFMSEHMRLGRDLDGVVIVDPFAPGTAPVMATMLDT